VILFYVNRELNVADFGPFWFFFKNFLASLNPADLGGGKGADTWRLICAYLPIGYKIDRHVFFEEFYKKEDTCQLVIRLVGMHFLRNFIK
jgi:hypothetical protein